MRDGDIPTVCTRAKSRLDLPRGHDIGRPLDEFRPSLAGNADMAGRDGAAIGEEAREQAAERAKAAA